MALLDMQRATKEIGRIRIGDSTPAVSKKSGKEYRRPRKLATFKFTTRSRSIADAVAAVFGGEVEYDPRLGYGVVTEASEIGVTIPPGDAIVNQAWELWDAGVCHRRCDNTECLIWKGKQREVVACMCPPEGEERAELAKTGNACKPTTRLNVIVPDLPDIGVWRLESHGYYAAGEIGDTARILMAAREADVYLPARLWLDKREGSKVPGEPTREFYVPMLTLDHSLRQLSAATGSFASALPPAPPDRRAITAGHGPAMPEPDDGEPIDAEIVPDEAPSLAQEIADRAAGSQSRALLTGLQHRATDQGLGPEVVMVDGEPTTLGDYLAARIRAFG